MFSNADFGSSPPPKPPDPDAQTFLKSRTVGAIVLILGLVILLMFVINADASVLAPYNESVHATQTVEASKGLPPGHPPINGRKPGQRPTKPVSPNKRPPAPV